MSTLGCDYRARNGFESSICTTGHPIAFMLARKNTAEKPLRLILLEIDALVSRRNHAPQTTPFRTKMWRNGIDGAKKQPSFPQRRHPTRQS